MKVRVTETCVVQIDQVSSVTYSPSDEPQTAPRAHIEEIERQRKGTREGDSQQDPAGNGSIPVA